MFQRFDTRTLDRKRLTREDSKASVWRLPGFFNRAGLTCLSNKGSKAAWTAEGNSGSSNVEDLGKNLCLKRLGVNGKLGLAAGIVCHDVKISPRRQSK